MEIDLLVSPSNSERKIETERERTGEFKTFVAQNEAHVRSHYRKLLIKGMVIYVIMVIVALVYFILPAGIFGVVHGRGSVLVISSIMLLISLLWIDWRTWIEARSTLPGRSHRIQQRHRL